MTNEEFTRWQIAEMKKRKEKTMLLVGGIGLFAFFIIIGGALSDYTPSNEDNYQSGLRFMQEKKYLQASAKFSAITKDFEKYSTVQTLLRESDSLNNVEATTTRVESVKSSLTRELNSDVFKKGFGTNYRGDLKSLQMELIVFGGWKVIIEEAESVNDPEIKKLSKALKDKVVALQQREFPILRREYAKFTGQVLWENNIEVKIKGSRNSTLEFTGGMFASNRNIKSIQETLTEQLKMFRFKRAEYKWMEYADEYTYYTLDTPSDGELFQL